MLKNNWCYMYVVEQLFEQVLATTLLEYIAVFTGILSVWFGKKANILVYPVGIVSVSIYIYLTFEYKLYAETLVHTYYLLVSIFGWHNWKRLKLKNSHLTISSCNRDGHIWCLAILVVSFFLIYVFLTELTDSTVPVWDSLTTAFAITAMYLMAWKKIEHWLYWIVCNTISIPLYAYKGLVFTSLQFLVFTLLAVMGWFAWKKQLSKG